MISRNISYEIPLVPSNLKHSLETVVSRKFPHHWDRLGGVFFGWEKLSPREPQDDLAFRLLSLGDYQAALARYMTAYVESRVHYASRRFEVVGLVVPVGPVGL